MFEAIRHIYINDSMTGAIYRDGDVIGSISFMSKPERTGVISSIGPEKAVRECSFSHWFGFGGRYRAAAREQVENIA